MLQLSIGYNRGILIIIIIIIMTFLYTAAPVIDPPSPSVVNLFAGDYIIFSCTSRGSPPDTFTWMKDSSPVTSSPTLNAVNHDSTNAVFRSDYTIKSVTTSDSGTYTCTVANPIGSDSQMIKITVYGMLIHGF